MDTLTKSLTKQTSGEVILPQDSNYQEARTIFNAMIHKQPALIVKCKNVEDVIAAVNYARENKPEVAIRSGGHSGPGLAMVENGLVRILYLKRTSKNQTIMKSLIKPSLLLALLWFTACNQSAKVGNIDNQEMDCITDYNSTSRAS